MRWFKGSGPTTNRITPYNSKPNPTRLLGYDSLSLAWGKLVSTRPIFSLMAGCTYHIMQHVLPASYVMCGTQIIPMWPKNAIVDESTVSRSTYRRHESGSTVFSSKMDCLRLDTGLFCSYLEVSQDMPIFFIWRFPKSWLFFSPNHAFITPVMKHHLQFLNRKSTTKVQCSIFMSNYFRVNRGMFSNMQVLFWLVFHHCHDMRYVTSMSWIQLGLNMIYPP